MKNTKLILLILLCSGLNLQAQDGATAEGAVIVEETTTETVTTEEPAEPAQIPEDWANCSKSFLNYVKSLPVAQQNKEFERWWMLSDREYGQIKSDEFKYKEEKPKKEKEYKELLAKPIESETILLGIKLGKYDFKKKGFPAEIQLNSKKTFIHQSGGGWYTSGVMGDMRPKGEVYGCSMWVTGDPKKKDELPHSVKFKPSNLKKFSFLPMDEELGKKVTAEIGSSRVTQTVLRLMPTKTNLVTQKVFGSKYVELESTVDIKELDLFVGEEKKIFMGDK